MTLSIIIPAYNAEHYIDRCFASVFRNAPSEESFEVIAVNDGSKDNTLELLKKQSEQHRNVIVINQPNSGVSVARNNGIKAAKGEYVLFLDVDDELINGALVKVRDYLQTHEPMDMLVTRQVRKNRDKEWVTEAPTLVEHLRYDGVSAYKSQYVRTNAGGGICRVSFLREHNLLFPAGVKNAEDTIFFGHLQVYAKSIVYYNLPLYRIHELDGSATRNMNYKAQSNSLLLTLNAASKIKSRMNASEEQKAIFDYTIYQLLSNTVYCFVNSPDLSFEQFKKKMCIPNLLPLDVSNMHMMRKKAKLMNLSIAGFYFLSWIKNYSKQ